MVNKNSMITIVPADYLTASFFSPPYATTVLMFDKTSSAMQPALE